MIKVEQTTKMAASSKVGGYECEFIDPISEDFLCRACRHVARDPNLTSCCGETFCQACIAQALEDKKPCPNCEKPEFTTFPNVKYQKRVLALKVHCTMKDRGCEWTEKLEDLDAHLAVDTGDCQYVDVPCPDCDQQIQKRELATHLTDACPKRDYNCRYCGFSGTYEVVCNDHWPICEQYPIQCPNFCGLLAIEHCTLEDHLKFCPLQEIECEFQHAGCNEKFLRQDLEKHMEQSTQNHLVLVSTAVLRINQEFKRKLQEQEEKHEEKDQQIKAFQDKSKAQIAGLQRDLAVKDQQVAGKLQEKDEQIREMQQQNDLQIRKVEEQSDQKIKALRGQIQEAEAKIQQQLEERHRQIQGELHRQIEGVKEQLRQKDQQIQELQQKQQQIQAFAESPPYQFIMPHFSQYQDKWWHSHPMRTHMFGSKFCIGTYYGMGSIVLVGFHKMKGEFDAQLQWPVKGTVTVELLNQHRDQDHLTTTTEFEFQRPTQERVFVKYFNTDFISKEQLGWNAQKQTQYLKDDCLRFRVTKVEVRNELLK